MTSLSNEDLKLIDEQRIDIIEGVSFLREFIKERDLTGDGLLFIYYHTNPIDGLTDVECEYVGESFHLSTVLSAAMSRRPELKMVMESALYKSKELANA